MGYAPTHSAVSNYTSLADKDTNINTSTYHELQSISDARNMKILHPSQESEFPRPTSFQFRLSHYGPSQPGSSQPGPFHSGSSQSEIFQPERSHPGSSQPATYQSGSSQPGPFHSGSSQSGPSHSGSFQPRSSQLESTSLHGKRNIDDR